MNKTVSLLEKIIGSLQERLSDFYDIDNQDTVIIAYHGLGNGAGWVTTYEGRPAIYIGVEKIVELGWDTKNKLEDLLSHEYGHLVHSKLRGTLAPYNDFKRKMIFRLYTEGVATYCENIFNGRIKSSPKWYTLCVNKEPLLKNEFLRRLQTSSKDILDFFGDWNPVFDVTEAGYYLGLQIIQNLLKKMTIKDIMVIGYWDFYREFTRYFDLEK